MKFSQKSHTLSHRNVHNQEGDTPTDYFNMKYNWDQIDIRAEAEARAISRIRWLSSKIHYGRRSSRNKAKTAKGIVIATNKVVRRIRKGT